MNSGEFARIVRDLQSLSESIKIECNKDGITFSCEGEIGNGSVTIKPTTGTEGKEDTATVIDLTEPVSLTFSTKYLVNFTKATPLSPAVKLSMSEEIPLLVEYPLNTSGSHLRFFCEFQSHPNSSVYADQHSGAQAWRRRVVVSVQLQFSSIHIYIRLEVIVQWYIVHDLPESS